MDMATRNVTLSKEEREYLGNLLAVEWKKADDWRMRTIPQSTEEQRAEDHQIMIENMMARLRGAKDEL